MKLEDGGMAKLEDSVDEDLSSVNDIINGRS